jgi:UDP-N-acetylmuramoylalanine-D-glutamate ligase
VRTQGALHEVAGLAKPPMAVARLLVEAGAAVRATDQEGAEPIHQAAQTGSVGMIGFLL